MFFASELFTEWNSTGERSQSYWIKYEKLPQKTALGALGYFPIADKFVYLCDFAYRMIVKPI